MPEYADAAYPGRNSGHNLAGPTSQAEGLAGAISRGTGYIRVIRCMINRLISGSVMAARFQSELPSPSGFTGLQSAATVSPTKQPPLPPLPAGGWLAGWFCYSN
jgi:hypothetical protein